MRRITKEDGLFIRDNYQAMKAGDIAAILGLSTQQVRSWASYHDCLKTQRSIFSGSDMEFIKRNYLTTSYKDIAAVLGFTERQVRGWINHNLCKKVRTFNDDYFSDITLPNRAYWLGFIYADGWIVNNQATHNYEFGMELRRSDRYMLELLKQELGGVHIILDQASQKRILNNRHVSNTESSVLRVYSKKLVSDLMHHGITCNKSRSDTFPIVDDDQFIDFLRGYFDGDGSLSDATHHMLRFDITGTCLHCFQHIHERLSNGYNIDTKIYHHGERAYKLVCYRKDDTRRLLELLYADPSSHMLQRKYQKYLSYYGLAA